MSDEITSDIASISTGTPESLAALRMKWQLRAQRARENLALVDGAILEHMEAAGVTRLVVSDSLELRAVTDKTTKLRKGQQRNAVLWLLNATGGHVEGMADLLCSDPFKPAACRSVLSPEKYAECFETVVKTRLEGKPAKKLAVVNPKLIPQGADYERD